MDIIKEIRKEFTRKASEALQTSGMRFFKEKVRIHGLKAADTKSISKKYLPQIKKMPKEKVFELCEKLLKSGYLEEMMIACDWAYSKIKEFEIADFKKFEYWVHNYISNWAACDTLCNHTIGEYLEMQPVLIKEIKKWTKSDNRWVRRASAVTLIIPARHGLFLKEIFQIADALLLDKDDMVQKGYGWMLKAASEAHSQEVFGYVIKNKTIMPRTALRYAIEKMPKEMKALAMAK